MERISNQEFIARFVLKIKTLLSIEDIVAKQCAEATFEDWDGIDTPEECAESEANYWGE
jgi:hypothetical protein